MGGAKTKIMIQSQDKGQEERELSSTLRFYAWRFYEEENWTILCAV